MGKLHIPQLKVAKALLTGFSLTFIVSCSADRHSSEGAGTSAPTIPTNQLGTSDSGGGNGFNGKPLESYKFQPMDRPEFKIYLEPLFKRTQPETKILYNRLRYVLTKKSWFLIPTDLTALPSERIGASFNTDQLALQNFDEIWIDQRKFEALKSDEMRAKLILHEMVMALKILKLESTNGLCMSVIDPSASDSEALKDCRTFDKSPRKAFELSKRDYSEIRSITEEIFTRRNEISAVRIIELLKSKNFDTKDFVSYSIEQDKRSLSQSEIAAIIQSNIETSNVPRFSNFGASGKAASLCNMKWNLSRSTTGKNAVVGLSLQVSDPTGENLLASKNMIFSMPNDVGPYDSASLPAFGFDSLNRIQFWPRPLGSAEFGYVMDVFLDGNVMKAIMLKKMTWATQVRPGQQIGSSRESQLANPRVVGNEPLLCYFDSQLPAGTDVIKSVEDGLL